MSDHHLRITDPAEDARQGWDACRNGGGGAAASGNHEEKDDARLPAAERVVRLVLEQYRLGQNLEREPFVVPRSGPNVAFTLSATSGPMRDNISREFHRRFGKVIKAAVVTDAFATLRGMALELPPEPTFMRVAPYQNGIVLDLGSSDGHAVVANSQGWTVEPVAPVLFRRSALTGELPRPKAGGTLNALRRLLNVTDESWPLVLGWLVAAFIPTIPHPILMLGGEQGTGKTTFGTFLLGLVDPSGAPVRTQPRDPDNWAVLLGGAYGSLIDNISAIPDWFSDALCKAVTGDGWIRRKLYTDRDLTVLTFRSLMVLTSIDAGALRGDLGERLVMIDLQPIAPDKRQQHRALEAAYLEARPAALGAILDLLVKVLATRDSVKVSALPRMADFAIVLAAMDKVLGTSSFSTYWDQTGRIARDVVESDPVGVALLEFMQAQADWNGTAGDLLTALEPDEVVRDWPKNARGMAARLKRLAPALAHQGISITFPPPNDKRRVYFVKTIAQIAQSPRAAPEAVENAVDARAIGVAQMDALASLRPTEIAMLTRDDADVGRSGDRGDPSTEIDTSLPFGDVDIPDAWRGTS